MSDLAPYAVDLEQLRATVAVLVGCDRHLAVLLDELRGTVAALHGTWEGQAAQGHLAAQAEWERGFADLREGLLAMRRAARGAHGCYEAAVAANLRLWGCV